MRSFMIFMLVAFAATAFGQEPKSSIPDEAAQKSAAAVIAEVYKPDYDQAKTAAEKIVLAKKLLGEGIATQDDAVSRFVLFKIARDMAAQQGDLMTAFAVIDQIDLEFEADLHSMQLDAAQTAIKELKTPAEHLAVVGLLTTHVEKAVAIDQYDIAEEFSEVMLSSARKSKDSPLIKQVTAQSKMVLEIAAEFAKIKEAIVELEAKPSDPEANLTVGKFLCFFKGDWERGVVMLALSDDQDYKALASLELEDQPDPLKIGDGWWKIADSLDGTAEIRTKAHAARWYRKALPGLSGLSKTRVERLIAGPGQLQDPFSMAEASKSQAAGAKHLGTTVRITNSIGMKLVLIPKGTFLMGSPKGEVGRQDDETQHEVTLSQDYYLGVYEVTQAQYEKVMGKNPSHFQGDKVAERHPQTGRVVKTVDSSNHPVGSVSWEDAVAFCQRLSELPEEKNAGRVYRLPTEAEWEYACRAGSKAAFSFGDNATSLGDYAWFGSPPHPVGEKKPNALGLYDMHGNGWEWCSDWYGEYPQSAVTDPAGPIKGSERVYRGSSQTKDAAAGRSARRSAFDPARKIVILGFRLALSSSGISK